jgi:hypothetical protein
MTEAAKAAKLWANFHHLTEFDQDLVLNFVKTIEISLKRVPCTRGNSSTQSEKLSK